jgi:membrane protein
MRNLLGLFKEAARDFGEDNAPRLGAALAYYTMFSIAPLLLIAIAIAGIVFGQEAAQGEVFAQMRGLVGDTGAKAVNEMVKGAAKPKTGVIATILGVLTLLFGASGVFGQLKAAMNTIWEVEPKEKKGVVGFIKDRFLSVAMVLVVGFLLLVALVLDTAISALGDFMGSRLPGGEAVWQAVQLVVSAAVITVLFAMIFRYLPDIRIPWRDVWYGAIFTAVLFVIGKFALGLYLGKKAADSSQGAAGALIVVLLWVYYSAQILFFGAEVTQVYARQRGSMRGEPRKRHRGAPTAAAAPDAAAPRAVPHVPAQPAGSHFARTSAMSTHDDSERSISEVVKSIADDLGRLVRGELTLLKTEMRENASKLGAGAGLFGGAGLIGIFALQCLLLALIFGLIAAGLRAWAAALIVGLLLAAVAAVLALRGKKTVANASVAPTETIEQVKTDVAAIKNDVDRLRSK